MLTPDDSSTSSSEPFRSEPRPARWLAEIVLSCVAVLLAFILALVNHRDALNRSGIGHFRLEKATAGRLARWSSTRENASGTRVVLFGDSLNICADTDGRAAQWVGRVMSVTLERSGRKIDLLDMTQAGLRPIHFYSLLGEVLETRPKVVVVEVNLRAFLPPEALPDRARLPHLARKLGLREAFAVREALAADGLSVLDPTLIRWKEQLGLLYAFEGLRSSFLDWLERSSSAVTQSLGMQPLRIAKLLEFARRMNPVYDTDYAKHPNVELLRGIRERVRASGARVVFYLSPVKPQPPSNRARTPKRLDEELDKLRRTVGATRAEWLDLHADAPSEAFRDSHNHLHRSACPRVGRPLALHLLGVLDSQRW